MDDVAKTKASSGGYLVISSAALSGARFGWRDISVVSLKVKEGFALSPADARRVAESLVRIADTAEGNQARRDAINRLSRGLGEQERRYPTPGGAS